jgi:TRAP-type C4-dicarboxylate transport system substrate-binding protein
MTTLGNGQPKNLQKQIMDRWKVASAEERGEWQTVATKYREEIERGAAVFTTHEDVVEKMDEEGWVPVRQEIF